MSVLFKIWGAVLGLWIRIGERFLPATVHPMMVHFPIASLYLALGADVLARVLGDRDRFFARVSFWLLGIALLAGIATAAAGVISEQYVHWTPTTAAMLSRHQRDAVLTGLFLMLAIAARLVARFPSSRRGGDLARSACSVLRSGRGRSTPLSLVLLLAAVVMITITASVGGAMVYHFGVGVHGVTFQPPPRA